MILQKQYNLIPFLGVLITVATMLWFSFQNIDVGYTYILLFIVPTVLLFALTLFINESSKRGVISKLKFPFSTSTVGGATLLLTGWVVYFGISALIRLLNVQFSITDIMVPLASDKTNILIQQSATQLSITANKGLQLFTTTFVASFIEEFIFGFVLVYVFYVLIRFISESVLNKPVSHRSNLLITFILLGISFAWIHQLNASYVGVMFLIAGIFRILMSASIYYAGLFLSFTIGFHQANNFFYYAQQYGLQSTLNALMSIPGLIMILYMALMVIIVANNFNPAQTFLSQIMKDFRKSVGRI